MFDVPSLFYLLFSDSIFLNHLSPQPYNEGCVKSKPNQLILHSTSTCKKLNSLYLSEAKTFIFICYKVTMVKMWSWRSSTWNSQLTALLTQSWWLAALAPDRFNFSFFCRPNVKLLSYFQNKRVIIRLVLVSLYWRKLCYQILFKINGNQAVNTCNNGYNLSASSVQWMSN